ncbi:MULTISPECIES: helix-turn-helix transcriptional regulator [Bacillus]|uniref:helix-turn-helix transcriptional regulator n=1 Tax=Bacillus TaxID=1386 RepID=UPI00091EB236|nr:MULTISPECIES: helix-turn-helix transcriptional regulator [Bacillus]MBR9689135.1 XRE family transcriptional regulator [Bacillus cereus]MDZ4519017.1 helix-turn-helix transcriptional regulator [Bacillus cereus]MEB9969443.1 helix-turn-helix transcriptional regulator [Bacillus cereus]SHM84386.1 DNA-binding transcriptional regulator, XRE-family HTH domain [Bacillus sp. bc15]
MKNTVGQNIQRLRKAYGLTQEQLSEKTRITRGQLKNWETDRYEPDLGSLKILASFFNVTTDTLLGFENEQNDPLLDLLLSDIQKDYSKLDGREQGQYARHMAVYSDMLLRNKDLL